MTPEDKRFSEMSWKNPTAEKWFRIGFAALVIVGIVCTVLILVTKLK